MSLRDHLIDFLKTGAQPSSTEISLKILSFEPMYITDDSSSYLEIVNIPESIDDLSEKQSLLLNKNFELTLTNWKFVFRRVPASHEYYFDIIASNVEVNEIDEFLDPTIDWNSLNEDPEIKQLSETKKRQAIETLLENNIKAKKQETPTKISGSVTKLSETKLEDSMLNSGRKNYSAGKFNRGEDFAYNMMGDNIDEL